MPKQTKNSIEFEPDKESETPFPWEHDRAVIMRS